ERLRLSAEFTRGLRRRARDESTTVHGALCGAVLVADWEPLPDTPLRLFSPVNIRGMVGAAEAWGNFVSAGKVSFAVCERAEFWDLARLAKERLAPAQAPNAVAASSRALSQVLRDNPQPGTAAERFAQGFAHELMVTNMGNLPIESRYGALELEAVWGPW